MKFLISAGHGGGDPGNTASGRVTRPIDPAVAKRLSEIAAVLDLA